MTPRGKGRLTDVSDWLPASCIDANEETGDNRFALLFCENEGDISVTGLIPCMGVPNGGGDS